MASIKNQVTSALKGINGINSSKAERKAQLGKKGFGNGTDKIHSIDYYQDVRNTSIRWAEFIKQEYGVKSVYEMKEEHTDSFLDHLQKDGVSKASISVYESHLIHLQRALDNFNKEVRGKDFDVKIITERSISGSEKNLPSNRSFRSREQAEEVISKMSPATRPAGELGLNLGLRVRESANLEHVDLKEMKINIQIGQGITKGGRTREIPIPGYFQNRIQEMIQGKQPFEKVAGPNLKQNTVEKAFKRACERLGERDTGFHRLRHTYARERLTELLKTIKNGQKVLDRVVDNKILGYRMDKDIQKDEKSTFDQVKQCINFVHNELGHGDNRWELVQVYMVN